MKTGGSILAWRSQAPGMQIENADFYLPAKKIDRGHIVRREDSAWGGTAKEAEFGNSDTYHWTNCTPQSEAFNQSGAGRHLGPVRGAHPEPGEGRRAARCPCSPARSSTPNDPEHGYDDDQMIQVPMEFWKVVVCVSEGERAERDRWRTASCSIRRNQSNASATSA